MIASPFPPSDPAPDPAPPPSLYTVKSVAQALGIHPKRVWFYYRAGLVSHVRTTETGEPLFDDEALYWLSQIHSLQKSYRVKREVLQLILHLLHEIERLKRLLNHRPIE
ncbi:chaperone modulator CbpM [Candidatus Methylacidithermus pantelleriae]|uniref:HTH merR-type domain-containing protein n=1 Tax=Candidatus Methylacidithermus pantelleriae TaxID=2744239 RepID=A0A8J2BSM7_9BACT|nr:MerR family transcriptional regulator [Candidatus Methylacidithermus pantelleriae]CAF0697216.1 hypothetical protein MPNT_210011 [Candidatus Methylacidithermus pantelleriae]